MNKFIVTGDYIQRLEISKISRPADYFYLRITEQRLTSTQPKERRKKYDATLSRDQLTKLRNTIDIHLASFEAPETQEIAV